MSIMERLYEGGIHPCEEIVPHSDEYEKAARAVEKMSGQLEKELTTAEYEKVDELCRQYSEIADGLARESFIYGLSLGLRLMREAETLPYLNAQTKTESAK